MNKFIFPVLFFFTLGFSNVYSRTQDQIGTISGFSVVCGTTQFVNIKKYSIETTTGKVTETILFPEIKSRSELSTAEINSLSGLNFESGFIVTSESTYLRSGFNFAVRIIVAAPGRDSYIEEFIRCPKGGKVTRQQSLNSISEDGEKRVTLKFATSIDGSTVSISDIQITEKIIGVFAPAIDLILSNE